MERLILKKLNNKKMNQKPNNIKIFLLCPIPDEQKPINEYIQLKQLLPLEKKKSFPENQILTFSTLFLFLKNFFVFIRWKEIEKRFNQPTIFYEEGSWYDGQIWEKPFSLIKNDRLLNSQIIKPYIKINHFLNLIIILIVFFNLIKIH